MPLPEFLLALLRCPSTKLPLTEAQPPLLEQMRLKSAAGELVNLIGQPAPEFDGALVSEGGKFAYLICENIPHLIADEAIDLESCGVTLPTENPVH